MSEKLAYVSDDGDYLLEGLEKVGGPLFKGEVSPLWRTEGGLLVRDADPFPELQDRIEQWQVKDEELKQEVAEEVGEVAELMQGLAAKKMAELVKECPSDCNGCTCFLGHPPCSHCTDHFVETEELVEAECKCPSLLNGHLSVCPAIKTAAPRVDRTPKHEEMAKAIEQIPVPGPRSFGSLVDYDQSYVLVRTYDGPDPVGRVALAWAPAVDAWTVEFDEGENPFYIKDIGEARAFTFEEVIGQLESWLRPVKASGSTIKQKWQSIRNYMDDLFGTIADDIDDLKRQAKQGSIVNPNDVVASHINSLPSRDRVTAKASWGSGPKGEEELEVFFSDGQRSLRALFIGVNEDNWIVKRVDPGLPFTERARIQTPNILSGISKWSGGGLAKAATESAASERGDEAEDERGEEFEPVTVTVADIPVLIEVPAGGTRSGEHDGQLWSHEHEFPYGEIPGTEGADGDPIDVILGPIEDPAEAFVIEQLDESGEFDEDKVMLGFESIDEAEAAYDTTYADSPMERGETTTETVEDLKAELFNAEDDLTEGLETPDE